MNHFIHIIALLLGVCHLLIAQTNEHFALIKVQKDSLYGYLNDEVL